MGEQDGRDYVGLWARVLMAGMSVVVIACLLLAMIMVISHFVVWPR